MNDDTVPTIEIPIPVVLENTKTSVTYSDVTHYDVTHYDVTHSDQTIAAILFDQFLTKFNMNVHNSKALNINHIEQLIGKYIIAQESKNGLHALNCVNHMNALLKLYT